MLDKVLASLSMNSSSPHNASFFTHYIGVFVKTYMSAAYPEIANLVFDLIVVPQFFRLCRAVWIIHFYFTVHIASHNNIMTRSCKLPGTHITFDGISDFEFAVFIKRYLYHIQSKLLTAF